MTATAAPTVKDQELVPFGLVESASVNAFDDFLPSKLTEMEAKEEKNEFINIFVCHLIFYSIYCISLVLYILIDLGLGSFVKKQFIRFIEIAKNAVIQQNPAFA